MKYPYIRNSEDFNKLKDAFDDDFLSHIEETIRLWEETDLIRVDEDTHELYRTDGDFVFTDAIAWWTGACDTDTLILNFADLDKAIQQENNLAVDELISAAVEKNNNSHDKEIKQNREELVL